MFYNAGKGSHIHNLVNMTTHVRARQQYLRISINGRKVPVHRSVCFLYRGPPPAEPNYFLKSPRACAMHVCGNRHCVLPMHIDWGTYQLNALHYHEDKELSREEDAKLEEDRIVA